MTRVAECPKPLSVSSICCIGAGHVGKPSLKTGWETSTDVCPGGPTSAVIALQNPNVRVTVVDIDAARIAGWNSRHLPLHEPGLHEIVRLTRDGTRSIQVSDGDECGSHHDISGRAPNLVFSTQISERVAEAEIILLSVNTPTKTSGTGAGQAMDTSALESATRTVAKHAKPGAIIVEKSTVPCRTAQIIRDIVSRPDRNDDPACADPYSSTKVGLVYRSRSSPIQSSLLRELQSEIFYIQIVSLSARCPRPAGRCARRSG